MQVKLIFSKYKAKIIVLLLLVAVSVCFIWMQASTNSVIQEVYDAFYSTDCYVRASSSKYYSSKDIEDNNIVFI